MDSLLLHTCCACCGIYCVRYWQKEGYETTAFWYNPNIHPFTEHQRRLEAVQTWTKRESLPLIVWEGYGMIDYFRRVVGQEGQRCGECFRLRLSLTAKTAREQHFTAFSTTLLISPYQKHELIREVGEEIARREGVAFLYRDLRSGFQESHHEAREMNLYRQKYCGCVYSEWERFGRVKIEEISPGCSACTTG